MSGDKVMKRLLRLILVQMAVIGLSLAGAPAQAGGDVGAPQADTPPVKTPPVLIAIADFAVTDPQAREIAIKIKQVIRKRLDGFGSNALGDALASEVDRVPEFATGQSGRIQFLIVGRVSVTNGGRLKVEARLWNVPEHRQLDGQQLISEVERWPQAADFLADEFRRALGEQEQAAQPPR